MPVEQLYWQSFQPRPPEREGVANACSENIPEGTLVGVRIWEYKGTSTRGNKYSDETHA